MNNYGDNALKYWHAGYAPIPDKYGSKMPAIKGWTNYCVNVPNKEEIENWSSTFTQSNIALTTGAASGIAVVDVDTDDPEMLELLRASLPSSPVERVGSKGFARFFKWNGISKTEVVKVNGQVIFEILAEGKKITIPPSKHPNGMDYKWVGKSLLEIDKEDLPTLPTVVAGNLNGILSAHYGVSAVSYRGKVSSMTNGRTDALVKEASRLISEMELGKLALDEVVVSLINYDSEQHDSPKFADIEEFPHTDIYTNALCFITDMLKSFQTRRCKENKHYITLMMPKMLEHSHKEIIEDHLKKKSQKQEDQKKLSPDLTMRNSLPKMDGLLLDIQNFILDNSWVRQPNLAFSASLAFVSTLINRKMVFYRNAPNLYLLNIAPSGSGKDAPQQSVKNLLLEHSQSALLGAGDYVSDASLMDNLSIQPARIDVIDEAGGLLKSVNRGDSTYNSKMADFMCELFTSSTSYFAGRMTAAGQKGACFRPFVNLLMSTTPRGFQEGVTLKAVEKGLLGRCLLFKGDPKVKGTLPTGNQKLPLDVSEKVNKIIQMQIKETHLVAGSDITQSYYEVQADNEAQELMTKLHNEFEELRINSEESSRMLPIIARCFQMLCKISLISAVSRVPGQTPVVTGKDVQFAARVVDYNLANFEDALGKFIFENRQEQNVNRVLNYIKKQEEGVKMSDLSRNIKGIGKMERQHIIEDLLESEQIITELKTTKNNRQVAYYRYVGGEE